MSAIEFEKFEETYLRLAGACLNGSEDFRKAAVFKRTIQKLWIITEKLVENGKKYNLTSILDPEEIIRKHIIDSLLPFCLIYDDFLKNSATSTVDVGTGAGFPLLPLAAVFSELKPEAKLLGIDSTAKKIRHVEETAVSAGMGNVKAVHGRAEELGMGDLREICDLATARAVASLPVILELCIPLLRKNGLFVALKSHLGDEKDGSRAIAKELGAREVYSKEYFLPGGDVRTIVVYRKEEKTPCKYPRRYSEISKNR